MSEFHATQPLLAKFRVDYLRLIWLSILFLIMPVLFIISGAVSLDHDLLLIIPFVVIPLGISIYRVVLLLINMNLEILVDDNGFTYTNKGETRRYLWKDIDKIWTTRFELVSIIYIKYIKVKILDTSGNILIVDRTLQKVDKFEALLQEQVARDKFPRALALLQQGKSLEFGEITVTKDYIKNDHDIIFWGEFGDVQGWQGSLRLWKKGKQAISMIISMSSTPNFGFLVSLLRYLSSTAPTSVPPVQDIKNQGNTSSGPGMSPKPKTGSRMKPGGNADARLSGLFLFLLGAGLAYWQMLLPIMKALRQESYISYMSEATFLAPLVIYMGLFLLVFGSAGLGFLSKPSSKLGLVVFAIGAIIFVLGGYLGMEYIMKSLGYY